MVVVLKKLSKIFDGVMSKINNSLCIPLGGGDLSGDFSLNSLFKRYHDNFVQSFSENQDYIPRLRRDGEAVFDYNFLMNLNEKDYAKYLCQAYYIKLGKKLNLKHPKTLNEKIQWLKIYDNLPIKSQLTDKILVRDWVKEKIGEEYLKPVLWIGDKFDDIPFEFLPEPFIVKTNHGCKWLFTIKKKQDFFNNERLFKKTKMLMENWLIQSFFGWSDFETQYKNIVPKIIIEPLLMQVSDIPADEIEVWCFNGKPKIIQRFMVNEAGTHKIINSYDENFEYYDINFYPPNESCEIINEMPDKILKKAKQLSEVLAKGFIFVRVDWMVHNNKLYFEEMTFTPHSGFIFFRKNHKELQYKLGKILNLKGD